jgi:hypothetical protein
MYTTHGENINGRTTFYHGDISGFIIIIIGMLMGDANLVVRSLYLMIVG